MGTVLRVHDTPGSPEKYSNLFENHEEKKILEHIHLYINIVKIYFRKKGPVKMNKVGLGARVDMVGKGRQLGRCPNFDPGI